MGRKQLGPEITVQVRDQRQLEELDLSAAQDGITRAEQIRRFIELGLRLRDRARAAALTTQEAPHLDPGAEPHDLS